MHLSCSYVSCSMHLFFYNMFCKRANIISKTACQWPFLNVEKLTLSMLEFSSWRSMEIFFCFTFSVNQNKSGICQTFFWDNQMHLVWIKTVFNFNENWIPSTQFTHVCLTISPWNLYPIISHSETFHTWNNMWYTTAHIMVSWQVLLPKTTLSKCFLFLLSLLFISF